MARKLDKDMGGFGTGGSTTITLGSVDEKKQRAAGLAVINFAPEHEWEQLLKMLGIKHYEPDIVRENGLARDRVTRRKISTPQ